jgi:prolyl-tRNA synthetase
MLGKARKLPPADADAVSHKLLSRAGYIDQLASGIFSLLPLGYKTQAKIETIIRQEMAAIGAEEVLLPALHPASLWQESGRLTVMDPPLFRVSDRHEKEFVLASTHEEVITDLARRFIDSYKDLPLAVFQIQTKFRNEMRFTGGLLRVREFQMKDLYSFHRTAEDLAEYYEQVRQAYENVFRRCNLKAHRVAAMSGTIGGSISHEFSVEAPTGEDTIVVCTKCDYAANVEALPEGETACPACKSELRRLQAIENGHIFQLGTKYSQVMNALFTDEDGSRKPLLMGCYGIGIGRLLATVAEVHHDDMGLMWPEEVAPFNVHVVPVQESVKDQAMKLAASLSEDLDVLLDDRSASAGQKFAEADLLGMPHRIVVSEKNEAQGVVEVVNRATQERTLIPPNEVRRHFPRA